MAVFELLKKGKASIGAILDQLGNDNKTNHSFIRSVCEAMTSKKMFIKEGEHLKEVYSLAIVPEKEIEEKIIETFGETSEETPSKVLEYFEDYGFNELVKSVSRQIDHNETIVREIDEDRLWLGRYVDFLDKAREWLSFFQADQAIAKEKLRKIEQKNRSNG